MNNEGPGQHYLLMPQPHTHGAATEFECKSFNLNSQCDLCILICLQFGPPSPPAFSAARCCTGHTATPNNKQNKVRYMCHTSHACITHIYGPNDGGFSTIFNARFFDVSFVFLFNHFAGLLLMLLANDWEINPGWIWSYNVIRYLEYCSIIWIYCTRLITKQQPFYSRVCFASENFREYSTESPQFERNAVIINSHF